MREIVLDESSSIISVGEAERLFLNDGDGVIIVYDKFGKIIGSVVAVDDEEFYMVTLLDACKKNSLRGIMEQYPQYKFMFIQ